MEETYRKMFFGNAAVLVDMGLYLDVSDELCK